MARIIDSLKESFIYKKIASSIHGLIVKINPAIEMNRVYYKTTNCKANIETPQNLIEKIFWLQLHTDTSMWSKCADKYAMRDYVKECGYESYLPKLLGKWDKASDIDFSSLPQSFILKTNNGCGTCCVVNDKDSISEEGIKKQMKKHISIPYGWSGAQLHYTKIKPCIIAEELLQIDNDQIKFSPQSLVDYKVWCFNGMPENILVVYNRHNDMYNLDLYSVEWKRLEDKLMRNGHYCFSDFEIPRPDCLNEMLTMASKLSKPFPEVRVDFYVINSRPIIGELTFTTGFGYFTKEYYDYLGGKVDLTNIKVVR